MGQYWKPVNLDKREYLDPHKLGCGVKLGEQLGGCVGDALVILCAAMRERRGGGDFDWDSNYYGPERDLSKPGHNIDGAPVVEDYNTVAKRTIGRWAGDRITLVGDYSEDGDLKTKPGEPKFGQIYRRCREVNPSDIIRDPDNAISPAEAFTDVTDDVKRVIEHERGGRFVGAGWENFVYPGETVMRWIDPQGPMREHQQGKILKVHPVIVVEWPQGETRTYRAGEPIDFH